MSVVYSTLVNYASLMVRLAASLAFAVILTRSLDPPELGLWGALVSAANVMSSPVPLWGYWSQRYVGRGRGDAFMTGLLLTLAYAAPCVAVYLALGRGLDAQPDVLLLGYAFGASLALFTYSVRVAWVARPNAVALSQLVLSATRVALGYALVAVLGMGLRGGLASASISLLAALVPLLASLLPKLRGINISYLKDWVRGSPVPALDLASSALLSSDRLVLYSVGGGTPVAYLTAVYYLRAPLQTGRQAATVMYGALLRGGGGGHVEDTLRVFAFLSSFTTSALVVLAVPLLSLLNPVYADAYRALWAVALAAYADTLYSILALAAIGSEEADAGGVTAGVYRSRLVRVPLISLTRQAAYLALALTLTVTVGGEPPDMAAWFAVAYLATSLPSVAAVYREAASAVRFRVPLRDMVAFTLSAAVSSAYLLLSGAHHLRVEDPLTHGPLLLAHLAAAGTIYVVAALALSPWLRARVRRALGCLVG